MTEQFEAIKSNKVGEFIQELLNSGHYNIKVARSTEEGYRLVVWTDHTVNEEDQP